MESHQPRILCYVTARRGSGHLTRQATILRTVRDLEPRADIRFLLRSPDESVLQDGEFATVVSGDEPSRGLAATLEAQRPDALLFDTLPPKEPPPSWSGARPACVLTLRAVRRERLEKVFDNPWADLVNLFIIPHGKDEFGLDLPVQRDQRVVFSGPIVKSGPTTNVGDLRRKYGINDNDFTVVASPGGGGVHEYFNRFRECIASAAASLSDGMPDVRWIIVAGPKNPCIPVDHPRVVTVASEPNLPSLFECASVVITHGGYNTTNEILRARVPIVFLPGPSKYDNGLRRAEECVAQGVAHIVPDFDADELVSFLYRYRQDAEFGKSMNAACASFTLDEGNETAARAVIDLVHEQKEKVRLAVQPVMRPAPLAHRAPGRDAHRDPSVPTSGDYEEAESDDAPEASFVLPVISWHLIDHEVRDPWSVTPDVFAQQLDWLSSHASVISLPAAWDLMQRGEPAPSDSVVLTFDDAYSGVYDLALPILEERGMTATVFVITGYMGGWNKWNGRARYVVSHMTWDQAGDMCRRGMTIGSHCRTHHSLVKFDRPRIKRELHGSADDIREALGFEPQFVAYPYGSFNDTVRKVARKRYQLGFASGTKGKTDWRSGPMQIHRIAVLSGWSLEEFAARVHRYGTM